MCSGVSTTYFTRAATEYKRDRLGFLGTVWCDLGGLERDWREDEMEESVEAMDCEEEWINIMESAESIKSR